MRHCGKSSRVSQIYDIFSRVNQNLKLVMMLLLLLLSENNSLFDDEILMIFDCLTSLRTDVESSL